MSWPLARRCRGCEFKKGKSCCPNCTHPTLEKPARVGSLGFCPKVKAAEIVKELDEPKS